MNDQPTRTECGECGGVVEYREFIGRVHWCLGPMGKAGKQIRALEAEVARLRAELQDIANARPSECDQCPYWAADALRTTSASPEEEP